MMIIVYSNDGNTVIQDVSHIAIIPAPNERIDFISDMVGFNIPVSEKIKENTIHTMQFISLPNKDQ